MCSQCTRRYPALSRADVQLAAYWRLAPHELAAYWRREQMWRRFGAEMEANPHLTLAERDGWGAAGWWARALEQYWSSYGAVAQHRRTEWAA